MTVAVIGMTEGKLLKQRYGAVFDTVAALLFEADPMGINSEAVATDKSHATNADT
jgi:hypothetical protein